MHYIYRITNLTNSKVYVGQSIEPDKRWSKHKSSAKGKPTQTIHHAMIKHGIENFSFEVIAFCLDQDAANQAEEAIILQEDCRAPNGKGYNLSLGGSVAPKSEEWKQQQSELRKGKPSLAPGNSPYVKGHKQSDEVKAKISAANKGNKAHNKAFTDEQIQEINRQYYKLGMSSRQLGKLYGVDKKTILNNLIRALADQTPAMP